MQHAVEKGKLEGYDISKYKDRNQGWKAAETSGGDCSKQGRKEQEKVILIRVPRGIPTFQAWHSGASTLVELAISRVNFSKFWSLQDSVLYGEAQLWTVVRFTGGILAAVVTEIDGDCCTISACGGSERHRWLNLISQIEDYARAMGCKSMRIIGRKGWTRVLPQFRQTAVVLERTL